MEFTPQILEPNFCTVVTNLRARPHEVLALGAAIYGSSSRPDILSIDPYAAIWAVESASASRYCALPTAALSGLEGKLV